MLLNSNDDINVLEDLEYRGIQSFLIDLEEGLKVPESMVPQIKRIITKAYECQLKTSVYSEAQHSGWFCGVEYKDEKLILVQKI